MLEQQLRSFLQTIEFDEGAGAVLRIQPLRAPRDENIYECVAENSEGEITVNAKLSIIRGESCPVEPRAEGTLTNIRDSQVSLGQYLAASYD